MINDIAFEKRDVFSDTEHNKTNNTLHKSDAIGCNMGYSHHQYTGLILDINYVHFSQK